MKTEYIIIRQVNNGWIIQREYDGEDTERVETDKDEFVDYVLKQALQTLSSKGQVAITINHNEINEKPIKIHSVDNSLHDRFGYV